MAWPSSIHITHHDHSEDFAEGSIHDMHLRLHRHPHHSHDGGEDFAERRTYVTHPVHHHHSHAGHDDHGEDFAERSSRSRWSLRSQACNTSLPLPRQHCQHSVSTLSTLNTFSTLDTLNTSNTLIILKSTGFTERALGRVRARATEHGKTGKGKPELSSQEENGGDEKGEHKDKDQTTETQRQKYTDTKKKTKIQRHKAKEGKKQKIPDRPLCKRPVIFMIICWKILVADCQCSFPLVKEANNERKSS